MTANEKALALFQPYATAQDFLNAQEMDRLIAEYAPRVSEGKLSFGNTDANLRRSRVVFLGHEQRHAWLYQRLWAAVQVCNPQCFDVDVAGIEPNVQIACYESSESGFYDWHFDFGPAKPERKLSISIQLSNSGTMTAETSSCCTVTCRQSSIERGAPSSSSRVSCCTE